MKSTSGKTSEKNNNKTMREKHAYVQGLGWATIEVNARREKNGINTVWQAYKTKINRNSGKTAGFFYIVFQMNKAKNISNFPEYQTKFWDQHTLKKADPETFSFWVNYIFPKKLVLLDVCRLMQSH